MTEPKAVQASAVERPTLYAPAFRESWRQTQLYPIAKWVNGIAFKTSDVSSFGRPVIKIAEIKNGISAQTKRTIATYEDKYLVRPGDLLFSWSGQPETSIGAFLWRGPEGWLNQHVFRVEADERVCDQRFMRYLLDYLRPNFIEIARNKQTTGLGHVTKHDLDVMTVRLPPLREQKAITAALAAVDDKIECNERVIRICQALADAIWSRTTLVSQADLRMTTLGQLVDQGILYCSDGYRTKQSELGNEGVPTLRVADVSHGRLTPSFKDHVREDLRPKFARKASLSGDVVLTTKGTVGRVAMVPEWAPEFVYSPQVCFFRAPDSSKLDRFWLHGWFRGPEFRERALAVQNQTDMAPYINLDDIRATSIALPCIETQRQIGDVLKPLEERAQAALRESAVLAELRATLLPPLLSGELRVLESEQSLAGES